LARTSLHSIKFLGALHQKSLENYFSNKSGVVVKNKFQVIGLGYGAGSNSSVFLSRFTAISFP